MNEQVIAQRIAFDALIERVASNLIAKKLSYGIESRHLASSVEDVMTGIVEKINAYVVYDWRYSGSYIPQTYDSPEEYPELEIWDEESEVDNPKPIPLTRFLKFVIKDLRKTQRSVNITPEQMITDRKMMKVVLMAMEKFREVEDVEVELDSSNGGGGTDTTIVQKGRFVRSGKVVFDYEIPEDEVEKLVSMMEENSEVYAPTDGWDDGPEREDLPEYDREWDRDDDFDY
jgi:hypothetical protein